MHCPDSDAMKTTEKTELQLLSEISRISNSSIELQEKLQRIVEAVTRGMEKDGASLFLIDRSGRNVYLAAAIGLNQESVGKLSFPLGQGIAGWVAEQKVPLALEDPFSDPRFQYVPETGIERFKSLAAAPILDGENCLGVIFVLSAAVWHITSSDITLVTTTANQISGVIRSAQLLRNVQQRLSELGTIHEISMAMTSTLDLSQLLSLIAKNSAQALHAEGCSIRLLKLPETQSLETAPAYSLYGEGVKDLDARIGESLADMAIQGRQPVLIGSSSPQTQLPLPAGGSAISVPLLFHERVIGVITVYNKQGGQSFAEDDLQFLSTIAGGAATAVENAAMYERMQDLALKAETRARELSMLFDISSALSSTLNLDRLLRIILTSVTMGGTGLGFNRAMLLLTNERSNFLQGMMGVGPINWDEAGKAWSEATGKHTNLMEWIRTGDLFERRDVAMNALSSGIRMPLDPKEGVLALTVLEKRPYNIIDASASPLVGRKLRELLGVNSFAAVPLIAKDRVLGVIVVDNMFTQRPITDRDMRFLATFASQSSLAIENAIIHTNLETLTRDIRTMHKQLVHSEKMAALGTMMAEIAHEIRNPLVSIGGFTRRLAKKVRNEDTKRYIDIIMSEVTRLEGIINDNLQYIKEAPAQRGEEDLNAAVEDILTLYAEELLQKNIRVEKSLDAAISPLLIDVAQMRQAIINLVTNAMEAMESGGVLTIRTYRIPGSGQVAVEIGDTGVGVTPQAMESMFNPYYTTKQRGTGLGLPITRRIITAHGGTIEVGRRDEGGAVFTIKLPYMTRKPAGP
jgi:two-component system, NtrC family, sensor histidine kinase HydH